MQISTKIAHSVSPAQLAKALANSSPKEFAAFWFAFSEEVKPDNLPVFAEAMAPQFGACRKKVLKDLVKLIEYFETKSERFT